jgi:iron complex transport system substrate-binding protein
VVRISRRMMLSGSLAAGIGVLAQSRLGALAALQDATPVVAPQLPVTITDATGAEVTVDDVSRIVPLSGDLAEIIWGLGLGENIVGADLSAVYPEALMELPKIGVERNLNAEAILALTPTVVIGKEAAGPPPVLEQVRGAGVPLVIIEDPQSIDGPAKKIRDTAEALGVPEAGEELALQTDAEIVAAMDLAAQADSRPSALLLYLQQGGVQLVAGGGTVASAMLEAAGATDAATQAGIMGYQPITAEALVAAAPEIIVTATLGVEMLGGVEALQQIPGIAETPAAQNGRIYVYDDELLLGMTPRTGQQLMAMVRDFHPELADEAGATPEATPAGA